MLTKTKKTLSATLIGAIALTGVSTAPARAGDNDALAAFLFGAGVLAIIAHESSDRRRPQIVDKPYYGTRKGGKCLRKRWTERGWVVYRNQKCVETYGAKNRPVVKHVQPHVKRRPAVVAKPQACKRKRWTNDGWKTFWSQSCLKRNGYTG